MLTGCRKSEVLTLQWQDVDREASELRLRESKTGPRAVPLSPTAVKVLADLLRPMSHFGRLRLDPIDSARVSVWFDEVNASKPGGSGRVGSFPHIEATGSSFSRYPRLTLICPVLLSLLSATARSLETVGSRLIRALQSLIVSISIPVV